MKTKNLVIALVFLLAINVTMPSLAQENIKAMIKKCENMDLIDANIVRNKKPNESLNVQSFSNAQQAMIQEALDYTNGVSLSGNLSNSLRYNQSAQSIIDLTLINTPQLEKELVAAFRKDQNAATREVEQIKSGKVTHMLYQFDDSEYSFTIKNDTINIRAIEGRARIQISSPLSK